MSLNYEHLVLTRKPNGALCLFVPVTLGAIPFWLWIAFHDLLTFQVLLLATVGTGIVLAIVARLVIACEIYIIDQDKNGKVRVFCEMIKCFKKTIQERRWEGIAQVEVVEGSTFLSDSGARATYQLRAVLDDDRTTRLMSGGLEFLFAFREESLVAISDYWQWNQGHLEEGGKYIVKPEYADTMSFSDGLARICVSVSNRQNRKWGYMDGAGQVVIPPEYDYAADFSEGLAMVRCNGKCGYVDVEGNWVIEPAFDWAGTFVGGYAWVRLGKRDAVFRHLKRIDKRGRICEHWEGAPPDPGDKDKEYERW